MKRYRIVSELGKGATGVVFRAIRSEDGSTVALKKLVLPGHLDAREEEEFIKRFKSEARAALALNHPGIVGALDCGLDDGTFYIAYELIEGVTFGQAIKAKREFSPEEVADILMQAAEALDHAHNEGVVHRDLSPDNIFITNDGKVRIADFGVAGFTSSATITPGTESIVGTPGYMAPEQITGSDTDPRSDIFSLGCVAYELLTNQPAFSGENIAQIIHNVISKQPPTLRELNPKVPLALEELVFRMLAKNPDYRYQSMVVVRNATQRVLEEIPRIKKSDQDVGHAPMLMVLSGPHEGETFNLQPTVTTIGRAIGDILLSKDGKVAQQHAWITKEETGWVLYDADTESGTFLNGESIEREEILPGDTVQVGETALEFRGAGGHVGVFKEPIEAGVIPGVGKADSLIVKKKRVPWILIILLMIPGFVVLAGLVMLGFVFPGQYIFRLDSATQSRWESALDRLNTTVVGGPIWLQEATDVLNEWQASPIVGASEISGESEWGPGDFMAPAWVFGSERINNKVQYRFELFRFAEEFLIAVTSAGSADDGDSSSSQRMVNPTLQVIRGLILRIDALEVPVGVDPTWEGRKFELLSVVRKWDVATTAGEIYKPPGGFRAERDQAVNALLQGWYTYQRARNARDNPSLLSAAREQLNNCIFTLDPVLANNPEDVDASAIHGLAYYLGAEILFKEGHKLGRGKYETALRALDTADSDISKVSESEWSRVIPADFLAEYPTVRGVKGRIGALRSAVQTLLDTTDFPE